ncbi:metalloregulator ArsR/SmtB family transcription factor [Actinoplanes sp. NPDC051633]|uniref:ArsR/SmtB family transcription factor n=1 Tax=Actinoplanes sp. NPDC051633 TaxID=3155670 RepID=UPI00343737B3
MDDVFRALADPTRRFLLDLLHEQNGQTLGELCERLEMTRQSATQHLSVLAAANLISTVRRGREKLHYLNPVPLQEMQERWIDKFERPRLRAVSDIKRRAETTMSDRPTYVYTTYIESTPEKVWQALTDADLTADYWGHRNESDWQVGSTWRHVRTDGSGIADIEGKVLESDPPRRLVTSWDPSRVTYEIEPFEDIVKLTVTHEDLATDQDLTDISLGWPAVLANLKTLLETGRSMAQAPWAMHR